MDILFIGDIHGETKALARALWWAGSLDDFDIVVLSGDIGGPKPAKGRSGARLSRRLYDCSVETTLRMASSLGLPIVFVPGNHDYAEIEPPPGLSGARNIDLLTGHDPFVHKGYTFLGVGGSSLFKGKTHYEWDDAETEARLTPLLDGLKLDASSTVLLAHDPPRATLLDVKGKHVGSRTTRKVVENLRPRLLLSGHIHESPAVDIVGNTVGVNAGVLLFSEKEITAVEDRTASLLVSFRLHFFTAKLKKNVTEIKRYVAYADGKEPHTLRYRANGSRLVEQHESGERRVSVTGFVSLPKDKTE